MTGSLLQDLRYAVRSMRRHPGFTAVALATLALAIGPNVAIFSAVNGVLLEALPYERPDRLMVLRQRAMDGSYQYGLVSPGNFFDWREQSASFETKMFPSE